MKTILSPVRTVLGYLLIFFDWLTRPSPVERSPEKQQEIEEELGNFSVYQYSGCPFCIKVRRAAHRLNLPLEYRDARPNDEHRRELKEEGGKVQVPCLRIETDDGTEWMYESDDIIEFLEQRFG